ncbi:NAD(P)/FAD-dependent oxidoreductase [Legionella clemsonensis]|uniref:Thioredoxin reductase n=1 Tax=Legionella clemsonensis TaxID=1867846 RepID=A0A222NYW5_9GAMM|nr:NAD(P)/FAD-dependent oxidoreductase [Legionella clemsonensis]ASQ44790.1 Thioredoxin reductase [Legionella clemsonensis]
MSKKKEKWDCIIVGGGPAGLTAAIYLARFRRNIIVYDTNDSRAMRIPISHNYPGFPAGISGHALLERLRQQLQAYNISIINEAVTSLKKLNSDTFVVTGEHQSTKTRNVLLATGVQDIEPVLPHLNHAIKRGLIRHCPVCDAYEVIDKKVAVIGYGKSGLGEASFLRDYTSDVTLITLGRQCRWNKQERAILHDTNITVISKPVLDLELLADCTRCKFADNKTIDFDYLYSALGSKTNNKLADDVKAKQKKELLIVNKDQETSVTGLYAAGDIVSSLHQLSVATGQAAIAATAIHNRCRNYSIPT